MNILISVHKLTCGGAERVAASWANGLSLLGHNVFVVSDFQDATYQLNTAVRKIQCPILTNFNFIGKIILRLRYGRKLWKTICQNNIDVLIDVLYPYPITSIIALKFVLRKRVVHIATDHNAYSRPPGVKMSFKTRFEKFFLNRFYDKVTVLTKVDHSILNVRGIHNACVLYNPLFLTPIENIPKKEKIVLAVGRIDAWYVKGFDLLIKAWNYVNPVFPEWQLHIVGMGSTENINRLSKLSIVPDSIKIKPFTQDIGEEYKRAAMFVLSSRYEGWGLALVEAMSQGCAAIACDYNGRQAEIITDGYNGLLCPTDNIKELAGTINNLIRNKELRNAIQRNAPVSVKRFSEQEVAKELESIVCSLKQ